MQVKDVLSDGGLLSTIIDNYKQRDGQIEMAETIDLAYKEKKNVIINAPTGNGKSIGGLVPAILNKDKGKTIISTATKSLQDQYQYKDIPTLHKILDFKSAIMKGRDNYVCDYKFNKVDDLLFSEDKIKQLKEWYEKTTSGDFEELPFIIPQTVKSKISSNSDDCLDKECPYQSRCHYKKNKSLAIESDVVVINHDLLALFLLLREQGINMFGDVYSIIVDEAHKLEEIMTKYLGFSMTSNACKGLIKNIHIYCNNDKIGISVDNRNAIDSLCDILQHSMDSLFSTWTNNKEETWRLYAYDIDIQLCNYIQDTLRNLLFKIPKNKYSLDQKLSKLYDKIVKRIDKLILHFSILQKAEHLINKDEYVFYVETNDIVKYVKLHVAPIDISAYMSRMLFTRKKFFEDGDIGCVTLLSATLFVNKTFDFIKGRLGINEIYEDSDDKCILELSIPEMFDYRHQCLLYIPKGIVEPSNSNKENEKQVFTRQIVKTLKDVSKIVDGGILTLFTSYYELDKVYSAIVDYEENNLADLHNNSRNILNQKLIPRKRIIEEFKKDKNSVLMATSSFWEGIDIQGDACSCVIIDKIPFPVPNEPIIEARIDKIKSQDGNWFNEYYLPMAIISLQQGFGRLIRTHKDLGMVVLMDNRVLSKPYGKRILYSLPDCLKTRKFDKVKIFFDVVKSKRELRGK